MINLSIILITYNGHHFLPKCLSSLQQELGSDCEVIIVDNASEDDSAGFVEQQYPSFRLIRNNRNVGFAAACNEAARWAQGLHLVFLNQDIEVTPGFLPQLLEPLAKDCTVGLVTPKIVLMSDPSKINSCGLDIHFTGMSFSRGFNSTAVQFSDPSEVAAVCGAAFAVRRDTWAKLGGFDEGFFMYFEDTDLSWRAQLLGLESRCVPSSIVLHSHLPQPSISSLYHSECNRWSVILKNWRVITLMILLPGLLLTELIMLTYCAALGLEAVRAKLRAYKQVVSKIPQILAARRQIQAQRIERDHQILRNRTWRVRPIGVSGGFLGQMLTFLCNAFFLLNYATCLLVLQCLKL